MYSQVGQKFIVEWPISANWWAFLHSKEEIMEDTKVVERHVTLDFCNKCCAVVRSDDPCGHETESLRLVEW